MIKTLGAIIIIGLSTLVGIFVAQRFDERCQLLRIWLRILEIFQTEICFQARPLPEIFCRTAALIDDRYFSNAFSWLASSLKFGSDADFSDCWHQFLVETGLGIISKSDYLALAELGNYLGSTDRHDQMEKINTCRTNLVINLKSAEMEQKKRAGLYRYLGFAAGAILVLWLI